MLTGLPGQRHQSQRLIRNELGGSRVIKEVSWILKLEKLEALWCK